MRKEEKSLPGRCQSVCREGGNKRTVFSGKRELHREYLENHMHTEEQPEWVRNNSEGMSLSLG